MLSGEQVVRAVRRFAPCALVAAQVAHTDRVDSMLDAGASTVFSGHVSPHEVGVSLLALVGDEQAQLVHR